MMNRVNSDNLDQWFFKEAEGQLNTQEVVMLNDYLAVHSDKRQVQELWQAANFDAIEIEEYPHLDSLLKGKSPWWEKGWFIYNSIALVVLIGILYCFQTSGTQVKLENALSFVEPHFVKKGVTPHLSLDTITMDKIKTVDHYRLALSERPSSIIAFKKNEKSFEKKEEIGGELPPNITSSVFQDVVGNLSITKAAVLVFQRDPEIVINDPSINTINSRQTRQEKRESNKHERKFKRNSRRRENKIYEQSIRNGSDPLVIPLNDFGF